MGRGAERNVAPSSAAFGSAARRDVLRLGALAACAAIGGAIGAATRAARAAVPGDSRLPIALRQLAGELARRGARSTPFVERRFSSLLRAPMETRGTLSFTPPDRLERIVTSPRREVVSIEGSLLTMQADDSTRARTLRIDAHPVLGAFADSLRATLAGDLGALQQHFSIEMRGSIAQWTLVLLPFDASVKAAVETIRITGQKAEVQRVEVLEPGGDRTELTLGAGG